MKIKLLLFCVTIVAVSGQSQAMMRSARRPVRRPAATRNYSEVAHIQSKYALPKACPADKPVAQMTREQLATHLKHQELCWKMGKSLEAVKNARKQAVTQAAQLVKISVTHGLAAKLVYYGGNDVGPELFEAMKDETLLSLKMARAAVSEYKKIQKDCTTAEQALAELVAEHKRQLRIPDDIQ